MAKARNPNGQYTCPLCKQNMFYITSIHAKKHNMSLQEYLNKFPKSKKFTCLSSAKRSKLLKGEIAI